jgi:hypothetical protein
MTSIDTLRQLDGRLDRPMPEAPIEVPADVQIDGNWLVWDHSLGAARVYRPGEGLLTKFVALAEASDEDIRWFAQHYGVLKLCREHGLPRTHSGWTRGGQWTPGSAYMIETNCDLDASRTQRVFSSLREAQEARVFIREPISRWREFAREAKGLLQVAAALHANKRPEPSSWTEAFGEAPRSQKASGYFAVTQKVNEWVNWAGLRPVLFWLRRAPPMITFSGSSFGSPDRTTLFSAITLRLMMAVVAGDAMVFCTHCGVVYSPRRRPVAGRRNFCPACRENGVPVMYAKRAQRLREQ